MGRKERWWNGRTERKKGGTWTGALSSPYYSNLPFPSGGRLEERGQKTEVVRVGWGKLWWC